MTKKRLIKIGIIVLSLGVIGWFYLWYTDPVRRTKAENRKLAGEYGKMWSTPIVFYGKVVDEKDAPISQAQVKFEITDTSASGVSNYFIQSDEKGLFSFTKTTGYSIGVDVTKDGYYNNGQEGSADFRSAGPEKNLPTDPQNPFVFRLRKKGETEPLIACYSCSFKIPMDGTPVEVNLTTGEKVPEGQGDIRVECWSDDQDKGRYSWRWRFSVPGGGLVVIPWEEEFPFEAPLGGYQLFTEGSMSADAERWNSGGGGGFFLKLRSGNYASVYFGIGTQGSKSFSLRYYLNPSGSRNLEYDKVKQINRD